jgi:hypothetical protein
MGGYGASEGAAEDNGDLDGMTTRRGWPLAPLLRRQRPAARPQPTWNAVLAAAQVDLGGLDRGTELPIMIIQVGDLKPDPSDPARALARGRVEDGHRLERATAGTQLIVAAPTAGSGYGRVLARRTLPAPEIAAGTADEITVQVDMTTWHQTGDHR